MSLYRLRKFVGWMREKVARKDARIRALEYEIKRLEADKERLEERIKRVIRVDVCHNWERDRIDTCITIDRQMVRRSKPDVWRECVHQLEMRVYRMLD